jgi:hypothetical protein
LLDRVPLTVDGDVAVAHRLLTDHVRRLDCVLQRLGGDLVEPRLLGQSLARGLDVQILVDVVGALDVGEGHPLVLVVGGPAGGAGVLEGFVRSSLELALGLVRGCYFGHVGFFSFSMN